MLHAIRIALGVLVVAATASVARAEPDARDPTARPRAALLVTASLGVGAHEGSRSPSLGLGSVLLLRDGPLLLGGTAGGDLFLHGYTTGNLGVLFGVARHLGGPWVRVELLGELGTRRISGVGDEAWDVRAVSDNSARLTYAGARLGALLGIGGRGRFVWGGWLVYREDLFRETIDVVLEDRIFGDRETVRVRVGGRDLSFMGHVGVEF